MSIPSKLIKANDLTPMPWKNGGGVAFEVAIAPPGATMAKLDFDWRVSIAQLDAAGPFSQFPGYDRKLVVWKGAGLKVNGARKLRLEAFEFAGETEMAAELVTEPVKDFGVIYRRGLKCDLQVRRVAEDAEATFESASGEIFVLCASGEVRIEGFYLNPGDLFRGSGVVQVKALDRAEIVVACISAETS